MSEMNKEINKDEMKNMPPMNGKPNGKGAGRPPMPKAKKGTFGRLMKYVFNGHKYQLIVVAVCILLSACTSIAASASTQMIIDDVITPGIQVGKVLGFEAGMDSVWGDLMGIVTMMIVVFAFGIAASFTYQRIMAVVTQRTLMNFRNDMFNKMQTLPVKFFDTHAHGDIMSTYTNDTDAIRMLVGQSLQMIYQTSLTV